MNAIELKQKWRARKLSPGMWLRLTDPTILDMIADVGYDWVMIDAEHQAMDLQTLQLLFMALKGSPTLPLVRVPGQDPIYIKQLLDAGAAGVLVPHIKTPNDVRAAVAACKYPPLGIRGAGPRRPGRYGRNQSEYFQSANEQTIVLVMIETKEAVENIDEILAVPGLDSFVIGAVDLSMSMGFLGDAGRPDVQTAVDHLIARAAAVGMPISAPVTDNPFAWLKRGAQIIGIADDQRFIQQGAYTMLEQFRELVGEYK